LAEILYFDLFVNGSLPAYSRKLGEMFMPSTKLSLCKVHQAEDNFLKNVDNLQFSV
jgi:hypothetical protein